MMNNTFSSFGSSTFLFGFHKLFALAFLLGLIFFIYWAIKNLKKDELKNWAITLLIIGLAGLLLTASFGGFSHRSFKGKAGFGTIGFGGNGMWNCMQDEECHEEMEESMHKIMGFEEHE